MPCGIEALREIIESLPRSPGVYIMKSTGGRALYIGKAANLRNRVRLYLDDHDIRQQIPALVAKVNSIEWIATTNESEALILEANLVRKHRPRYNIELKDDKHYPYLKVTLEEAFPRLIVTRRVADDGGRYFGPYTDASTMRRVMSFAKKAFRLCDCKRLLRPGSVSRPCINYSMGRCSGACAGKISQDEYRRGIDLLLKFLSGRRLDVVSELASQMSAASEALEYERAASLRDQIEMIRSASRLQKVDLRSASINTDVFGVHNDGRRACLAILCFRQGLLLSKRHFLVEHDKWFHNAGSHDALLLQYYEDTVDQPPSEVLVEQDTGFNPSLLQQWFSSRYGQGPRVIAPRRGQKAEMVGMAKENARLYLMQKAPPDSCADLHDLQTVLNLPRYPRIIEAFDISNLGGAFAVAGMVRFDNGVPDKSNYRRFKIRGVERQDDFAMLLEAVTRRLVRLSEAGGDIPDLLLIDGGKGQLHAAMKALGRYESPPMIASLAKREEILHSPYAKRPIALPDTHPARRLVERVRNEVHRFAVAYHRSLRGRQFSRSSLSSISGIGPKRAAALLKHFGSLKRLRRASVEDIAGVRGFSIVSARTLKHLLNAGR